MVDSNSPTSNNLLMFSLHSSATVAALVVAPKSNRCASNACLDTICIMDLATKAVVLILAMSYTTMLVRCSNTVYHVTILAKHARDHSPISAKHVVLIIYVEPFIIGFLTLDSAFVLLE